MNEFFGGLGCVCHDGGLEYDPREMDDNLTLGNCCYLVVLHELISSALKK